ncbi:Cohesin loading factor [Teratosphaeria destructans]|uniref:Cohesin loading factor n=1 Tax=Teratosphaeria destructans TaxID=418781 RepID=A0A9W7SWZ9_9PEZI|nr:Cohesin loading factor [Teratosphaeria destructans]
MSSTLETSDESVGAPPSSQQRLAYVEIPRQQHSSGANVANVAAPRSPKRRRSNNSDTIEVHHVPRRPVPQHPSTSQRVKQQPLPTSSPSTVSSRLPSAPAPNVDYQTILLALSDEYVSAAYELGATLSPGHASDEAIHEYHSLMSTAMGCLESVLNNYRQSDASKEAQVRLRLAALLHDETENSEKAEEILTKGIAVCDRSRLVDQKYAMHHLLIRIWAKSSPKAAMKAAEKLIAEVEAMQSVQWLYAFRFLRVSLSVQSGGQTETANALRHLTAISTTADNFRHVSVQIVAASLEALVHIISPAPDALDYAERALAAARTHQLSPEMQFMPQVKAFIDCLDLACVLVACKFDQIDGKMAQMDKSWDTGAKHASWRHDGVLFVPLDGEGRPDLETDTGGVLKASANNGMMLALQWLPRHDRYSLRYLLNGIAQMHKAAHDEKPTIWLKEGLKTIGLASDAHSQSFAAHAASAEWQSVMRALIHLQLAFAHCARSEWMDAQKVLETIRLNTTFGDNFSNALVTYLQATCNQALGNLQGAITLYQSPQLTYAADSKCPNALKDLKVLATLNTISILHKGGPEETPAMIARVEQHCIKHSNPSFRSAYNLVKAAAQPQSGNTILKTKQYLQSATQNAQVAANHQLMAICINIMSWRYFQGIVVEQAQKSVKAARTLAKRAGSTLWTAVAEKMFANTLELCGEHKEAQIARAALQNTMAALPQSLKDVLAQDMAAS